MHRVRQRPRGDGEAAELGETQHAHHPQDADDVGLGADDVQEERHDGEQVEQGRRRHRIAQAAPESVAVTRVLGRDPHPGDVLDQEHEAEHDLDRVEQDRVAVVNRRLALHDDERHRHQDRHDDEPVEPGQSGFPVAGLQFVVQASTQIAGHAGCGAGGGSR